MTTLTPFRTTDVESKTWSFSDLLGKPYVAIFGNRHTAGEVTDILTALQGSAATADLDIVQVAHVSGLPKPLQKLATRSLRKARNRQVVERAAHRTRLGLADDGGAPLHFALDWDATVTDAVGFTHGQKTSVTLLVDAQGTTVRRLEGAGIAAQVAAWYQSQPVVA